MRKRMLKTIFSILVSVSLLFNISSFSGLAKDSEIEVYTIMSGIEDDNGNIINDYIVDSKGNIVDLYADNDAAVRLAEDTLPASYSSVDKGIITKPKHQGGSYACWAFSTVSALETSSIIKGYNTLETADFSESHLSWFTHNSLVPDIEDGTYGDGRSDPYAHFAVGGWRYASATLARGSGLQIEKNAPWITSYDENEINSMTCPESDRYVSYLRLKNAHYLVSPTEDEIKNAIMEYGSLMAAYYNDYSYFANNYSQYYFDPDKYEEIKEKNNNNAVTNHAITIVGWDDNYSKNNFNSKCRPKNNGAWLCKNSWGAYAGEKGYFWLSYDESSLTSFVYYEAMEADTFDKIYQYDGATMKLFFESYSSASMANTFVSERNELLTHVGFFSVNESADVTVKIYKGKSNSTTNPTSGAKLISEATTTASDVLYGYSTVKLSDDVLLQKGETFSVVVTFNVSGGEAYIATENESNVPNATFDYAGNPGESFMCINGKWYDTSNVNKKDYNNVCVKAMTVEAQEEAERLPGDANDDGLINLKDVIFIRRFLAGGFDVSLNEFNADVDSDKEVTLADAVLITRFLAGGYKVTLE